jgi:tetratricopeptide (TPR) repeat protein
MTLRFRWTRRRSSAAPAGDRLWPVLGVLVGLISGAVGLEIVASHAEPTPLVVQIGENAMELSDDDEGDESDVMSEAPALNENHARARSLALRGEREEAVALFAQVVAELPEDAALRAEFGFWLLRTDAPERARAELDRASELQPKDPRVAFKRGLVLARLGDRSAAEREYERALSLLPTFDRARVALGNSMLRRGAFERTIEVLEPAAKRGGNQDRARALVAMGRAEIGRGNFDRAERIFNEAIERAPAHAEMRVRIGRAWLRSSRPQDVNRALTTMTSAHRLAPDSPKVHSAFAQTLERAGDDEGAEREYEDALRLDPHYEFVRKRLLHRALDREDLKRARIQAERLVAEDQNRPEYLFLVGLVAARSGDVDEARQRYQAAIDKSSDGYPEAWLNLGRLEVNAGKLDVGVAAYRRAIELRPTYAAAQNNLGLALDDQRDADGAENAFRAALAINPQYAAARVNLGSSLSRRGRYDEAIAQFEKAIELRTDYPSAELNLSVAYLRKGESGRAVAILQALLERRPRYVAAWYDLGLAQREAGDTAQAMKSFRQALKLNPEHHASLQRLAELERDAGRLSEAAGLYRELLDRNASDTASRLALADLSRRSGDRPGCVRELRAVQSSTPNRAASGKPTTLCAGDSKLTPVAAPLSP